MGALMSEACLNSADISPRHSIMPQRIAALLLEGRSRPMPANVTDIEKRLWASADELRANSRLCASEYSAPVLGLIFLRFADQKFAAADADLKRQFAPVAGRPSRRTLTKDDYQAANVLYLPEDARYVRLLALPESANVGQAINDAMRAIEAENPELRDVLPKTYNRLDNSTLVALLRIFNDVPVDGEGDAFGQIYEYFLGKFAMTEGQKGGEFFTPTAIVKLIVDVIEPYHGRIFDPACGSGGMFVQSADFVTRHRRQPNAEISIYGQERAAETVRLCRMNLAVHGLSGDIRQANTYYEDAQDCVGRFDFVMANPPFNVDRVDKERLKDDRRFPFGMPRVDNANYLWISLFYSALPTARP
jgi:type I restriction enzyme M protein